MVQVIAFILFQNFSCDESKDVLMWFYSLAIVFTKPQCAAVTMLLKRFNYLFSISLIFAVLHFVHTQSIFEVKIQTSGDDLVPLAILLLNFLNYIFYSPCFSIFVLATPS